MIKSYQPKFKTGSLFICQKCGAGFSKSQPDLAEKLKSQARQILKDKNQHTEVRVMVSGCLGVCANEELTVAYYPNSGEMSMLTVSHNETEALAEICTLVEEKISSSK